MCVRGIEKAGGIFDALPGEFPIVEELVACRLSEGNIGIQQNTLGLRVAGYIAKAL